MKFSGCFFMIKFLSIYCEKNILKILLYGFICGMNLLLSGNIINFWLSSYNIDTKIIGLFACIALPYALKYFISLFIQVYKISFLKIKNTEQAWLVISNIVIVIALLITSFLHPHHDLVLIALLGFIIAFFTTIQDIVLNANRIKILPPFKQPIGISMYTVGYRLGMLFSGAGVIYISAYLPWKNIYILLAGFYLFLGIILFFIYEKNLDSKEEQHIGYIIKSTKDKSSLYNMFIKPFEHFISLNNFTWVALFIVTYRLADNMLVVMLNPFLLHMKFTAVEIAKISKFFGTIMIIIGGVISGHLIQIIGLRRSLIYFSLFHGVGHSFYILFDIFGKNLNLLYFIVAYGSLTSGMAMTAYFSFISSLCKGKYVATQYALLSSGIGLSRVIFPISSGFIVENYNWIGFFYIILIISLLVTLLTAFIPKNLYKI